MTTFLIGFMGSGKSTIARQMSADFIDMDAMIVERIGMPIAAFFETQGEAAFRQIEKSVLSELVVSDKVVSTGGGIVISPVNRQILKDAVAKVIYLKSDFDSLYNRISSDTDNVRPIFVNSSRQALEAIFNTRQPLYEEVASQIIDVTDKTPSQIVQEVKEFQA
ncbi:shikimate kinase [Pseudolactococcus insecticola]|uniref:Shikimate kinase n=1 Tax=Pseudolactococcus insecticola TaxID=2709158 RepID=A0A6A0B883_9LACT|nr:shikimate kinase [Lactococcus insecticola]GFH40017.1 shikimate kinase [Lactococcus insecticola]